MSSTTILRIANSNNYWEVPTNVDPTGFDFGWRPGEFEPPFIHQFGTQWQKTGGPRLVIAGATDVKYQDWQKVKALPIPNNRRWRKTTNIDFDFSWHPDDTEPPFIYQFTVRWGGKDTGPRYVVKGATQVKYVDDPIATMKIEWNRWVTPDEVDMDQFDYTWRPPIGEDPYIYQFGTQWQKTGGPCFVAEGATQIKYETSQKAVRFQSMNNWQVPTDVDLASFDFSWHPDATDPPTIYQFGTQWQKTGGPKYITANARKIKYVSSQTAIKKPSTENWECLFEIDKNKFDFSWHPDATDPPMTYVFGNQWRTAEETPTVLYKSKSSVSKRYVVDQIATIVTKPLDIVFVSNGEIKEEDRYESLCKVTGKSVEWVRGISGRENALRRAAEISTTDWVLVFPGKLRANPSFDFSWHPNPFLEPKHYIFYATNPVNGLVYGHMAAVAYHRQLVLDTTEFGLDFTMSKLHDIVPVNSGVAEYNHDPFMCWRTAFRETVKLSTATDEESKQRLSIWTTIGSGKNAKYSLDGAIAGVEYYHEVDGDPEKLQLSFAWDWLRTRFEKSYK